MMLLRMCLVMEDYVDETLRVGEGWCMVVWLVGMVVGACVRWSWRVVGGDFGRLNYARMRALLP